MMRQKGEMRIRCGVAGYACGECEIFTPYIQCLSCENCDWNLALQKKGKMHLVKPFQKNKGNFLEEDVLLVEILDHPDFSKETVESYFNHSKSDYRLFRLEQDGTEVLFHLSKKEREKRGYGPLERDKSNLCCTFIEDNYFVKKPSLCKRLQVLCKRFPR